MTNEIFIRHELKQILVIVTKINLERAVCEYTHLFRAYTKQLLELNSNHYIFDFTNTNFLDSTFYGTMILFLKQIKAQGKTLKLVIDSEKNILFTKIIKISSLFEIYSSFDKVIASY